LSDFFSSELAATAAVAGPTLCMLAVGLSGCLDFLLKLADWAT